MKKSLFQAGFTIPDLLISIAIFSILIGFSLTNLPKTQRTISVLSSVNILLSDMRLQQIKAMSGDTQATGVVSSYGIYFGTNSYTLFRGTSYSAGDTTNVVVNLDTGLQIATPNATLVFTKGSGTVAGFVANGTNTFAIKNPQTGEKKTITTNQYGVVVQEK